MTRYVEIEYTYIDNYGDRCYDKWWAVKTPPDTWECKDTHEIHTAYESGWRIKPGEQLEVHDKHDIGALRLLLDAIEKEITEKENT